MEVLGAKEWLIKSSTKDAWQFIIDLKYPNIAIRIKDECFFARYSPVKILGLGKKYTIVDFDKDKIHVMIRDSETNGRAFEVDFGLISFHAIVEIDALELYSSM